MKRLAASWLIAATAAFAQPQYDLQTLSEQPKSHARDLFLQRLLQDGLDANETNRAFFLTHSAKSSHIKAFADKNRDESMRALSACQGLPTSQWLSVSPECTDLGFSFSKLSGGVLDGSFDAQFVQKLSQHIGSVNPQKGRYILALNFDIFKEATSSKEAFEYIFYNSDQRFREKMLNAALPKEFLDSIANEKLMKRVAKTAQLDANLTNLQQSLLGARPDECNCESRFWLALSALKLNQKQKALEFLDASNECSYTTTAQNRALFWRYLVAGDEKALEKAAKSHSNDLYALFAKEQFGTTYTPATTSLTQNDGSTQFDTEDPFEWLKLREKIRKSSHGELQILKKQFADKKLEPFYFKILQKAKEVSQVYLMPYEESFKNEKVQDKALYLAIARAESEFVPGDVSGAYAIGVMQLIPLLAEELAQKKREKLDFFELFKPEKNISYAISHFKWLQSKVKEPLFVAYSYNAGYGFFQRKVIKAGLFGMEDNATKTYEPWWSIENIPYDETKEYGKKVVANYIVYRRLLNDPITAHELLQNLSLPLEKTAQR